MTKRERVKNFTEEEKIALVRFVKEHREILESKKCEPRINNMKRKLWDSLATELNSSAIVKRDGPALRSAYQRLKQQAKAVVVKYKNNLKGSHEISGPSCVEEPSQLDWAILENYPLDFREDEPVNNIYNDQVKEEIESNDGSIADDITNSIEKKEPDKRRSTDFDPLSSFRPMLKKRKVVSETQSALVALHEKEMENKMILDQNLIEQEIQLIQIRMKNEETLHELQLKKERLKIENEIKKQTLIDLQIEKSKVELELLKNKIL